MTPDARLAAIAGRQHGLVARRQPAAAGLTPRMIERRVARGSLLPIHRGVYAAGHRPASTEGIYTAAVLACGPGAVLSGMAAANLLELTKGRNAPRPEVMARTARRVAGVRVRRLRSGLDRADCGWVNRIPATSPARTVIDLAAVQPIDDLARSVHEAIVRHHLTPRLFLALLRLHHLPLPETNKKAGTRYVDCRWPKYRLTVELDSYTFHKSRQAWENDRRREREAYARGDQFRRFTWGDVVEHPAPTVRELRPLLSNPI